MAFIPVAGVHMALKTGSLGNTVWCEKLAAELNRSGDLYKTNKFISSLIDYTDGLNNIILIPTRTTRHIILEMWYTRFIKNTQERFKDFFDQHQIDFQYVYLIAEERWIKARDHGLVLEKLNA